VDFGDKYVGAARIGHGAAGTVYRARSVAFDRLVAIKLYHGTLEDERLRHYVGGPFTAFLAYSIDGSTWVNGPATTFNAPS
jgi:serine/threonine protein kinase